MNIWFFDDRQNNELNGNLCSTNIYETTSCSALCNKVPIVRTGAPMKPRSLEDIPVFYVFKVTCQHHYTATKIQYGQGIFTIDKNFDHGHNISRCSSLRWMLILFPNSVGHERVWNQYAGLCIQKVQIIFKPSKNSDLQKEMWCMFVSVYLTNWNLIYQTYRWSEGNIPENS